MARKPKIYIFKGKKGQRDIIIFDRGSELGDIYIYELKEGPIKAIELETQKNKYGGTPMWEYNISP